MWVLHPNLDLALDSKPIPNPHSALMDESPSILVYFLFHFRISHVSKKNSDSVDKTLLKQSDDASNLFTWITAYMSQTNEKIVQLQKRLEDETSARKKLESNFSAYKSQTTAYKPTMVDTATQMSNPSSPTPKRFVSFTINKTVSFPGSSKTGTVSFPGSWKARTGFSQPRVHTVTV